MAFEQPPLRIGDAERDRAVSQLQEHLSAGRLDATEFDERIGDALKARTQPELDRLFADLPDLDHGRFVPVPDAPTPVAQAEERRLGWSDYAIVILLVALAVFTRQPWLLFGVAAWVGYKMRSRTTRPAQPIALQASELPQAQRREITALINDGQKIQAIKRYRELTGAGLGDAKTAIETWQGQLER